MSSLINLKSVFLLIVLFAFFTACSSSKKVVSVEDKETARINELFQKIGEKQLDADWVDAKARLKYEDESFRVGLSSTLRMKKDSLIWASMRKLGFEVARVLVRPDSVFILDRINNEYIAKDLSAIKDYIDIPADFSILQSLILGNLVMFSARAPELEVLEEKFQLTSDQTFLKSAYLIDEEYNLEEMVVEDKRSDQLLEIVFEDYQPVSENKNFSYLRTLKLKNQTDISAKLDVKFSKVEFNIPKNTSFEVPKKYTKID